MRLLHGRSGCIDEPVLVLTAKSPALDERQRLERRLAGRDLLETHIFDLPVAKARNVLDVVQKFLAIELDTDPTGMRTENALVVIGLADGGEAGRKRSLMVAMLLVLS